MGGHAARRRRGAVRRAVRRAGLLAAQLVLACAGARVARAQALPAGFDQGIFELRVARVAAETMPGLLSPAGAILLPIERVLAITAMPATRTDSTLTVERARAAGPATLRFVSRRLTDASGAAMLRDDELVRVDGVYYLATTRIATLLGAVVDSDLGQLAVTLTRTPPFPVEQAAARARRTAAGLGRVDGPASLPAVPFVPRSGGAVFDWNASTSGSVGAFGGSGGNVRIGAALFGGDISAGTGLTVDAAGSHPTSGQWSYRRGLPDNRYVRQLQVGDIVGGGAQLRSLHGVTFTNSQLVSDQFFGNIPVDLSLPQGWQYELYQDGQLVGFSEPGRNAPLYVPLRYGATPVQVRLVSPTGDETVRDLNYLIPQSQQKPGRLEYVAGAGRCASLCGSTAFANLSYGLLPWLSASAGAERQATDSAARIRPEGGISVVTYSGWNGQLQAARASFERASIMYGGLGAIGGSASYTRTHPGADQPSAIAAAAGTRWLFNGLLQLRPASAQRVVSWRVDNTMEGVMSGTPERLRMSLTADLRAGSAGMSYETDRTRGLREMGLSVLSILTRTARSSSILGTALFDAHSLNAVELSTSMQLGPRGAAAVTTRLQRGTGPTLSVGYNGVVGTSRLTSRFAAAGRQPASLAVTASGSAALDGTHRPSTFEGPGVGLAGVAGRVYYDLDGDGAYGPLDRPASDVRVYVNGAQTRSDSTGAYHMWNVVPYEPSEVAIDTLAFSDPSWMLARGRTIVRATPGMFNQLDFPLVRTRELAGRLNGDSTVATVGGVGLLLTPAEGGQALRIVTFSDGSFYVSRVRPGTYRLTVAQSALDALGAEPLPASRTVVVTATADEPVLEVAPIQLRRRPGRAPGVR
jgi:hypothetical protein